MDYGGATQEVVQLQGRSRPLPLLSVTLEGLGKMGCAGWVLSGGEQVEGPPLGHRWPQPSHLETSLTPRSF